MNERDDRWKERFRARVVHWTRPAAGDRRRALAVSNRTGVAQLYSWDLATGELKQVTDRPDGTTEGAISAAGDRIYYLDDSQGDEIGHWVGVPAEGGEPVDLTPGLPLYTSEDLHHSADGRWAAFTGALDDGHTVFLLEADGPREIYRSSGMCWIAGFDHDGRLLAVMTNERTGRSRYSVVLFDTRTGDRVAELWDGPESSLSSIRFSPLPGDQRVLGASDASGERRAFLWDPRSGQRDELPVGGPGETFPFDWSADGTEILLCRVHGAVQELSIYEVETHRLRSLDHPAGMYGFFGETGMWFDADGGIVAQWQDATHPATVVLLDNRTGRPLRELLPPTPVPPSLPWRSVTFTVDDDQPIQAWLCTPEGEGPFAAVIETHGGPESVAMQAFLPRAQAWVDRGFAYLTVNYRGSTTFGRQFREAIWGRPGELEVRDIVAARQWLVDTGIADPDRVFKAGWSYGGFLTLHALGTAPGLWAGGMAGIAVADWVSEYEDENDVLRAFDRALFGGSPDEKMEAYVRASPITYADRVDAPVLIIQGRNDTRCPARQVELYEARMRELGKPIEVIWFDAGHAAGADVERAIEHHAAMMDFASRVLRDKGMVSGRSADAPSGGRR
jgi:dienelactone hydrolase/Tol biopolymer transport system component